MIDKSKIKPGDCGVCLEDPKKFDTIEDGIKWFQQFQSKHPEGKHIFYFVNDTLIAETQGDGPRKSNCKLLKDTNYDSAFDKGLIVIRRPLGFGNTEYAKVKSWTDLHMGLPYGYDDIATFAAGGIFDRLFPWWASAYKKTPLWFGLRDWTGSPVCSQFYQLMAAAMLNYQWGRKSGIGWGRLTPGDTLGMPLELKTSQSKNSTFKNEI